MKKLMFMALTLAFPLALGAQINANHKARAAALVEQMTLEEKMDLVSGKVDRFHTHGIPRLGIPAVRMADGPQGVRNIDDKPIQSTYYPCGISAAATWNREVVFQMGAGIGAAAKARDVQIMLAPGVNIYRSALCGRNFEYYGEDPYLAGETASAYIRGMQGEGVMATIKHFALNQQEYNRHGVGSVVDERTLNEIYFPAFRKAVEEAGVGAVMTSYNMVNGAHAAENPSLVCDNLRAWGFEGIVMTDWTSTYSTVNFMSSGVDLEMPRARAADPALLKPLLENGVVAEEELDEKCRNILQTLIAFGFLDTQTGADPSAEDEALSKRRAYEVALEGPVLLKNEDAILPLRPGKNQLVAVVGPNANAMVCGGGSGWLNPKDGEGTTLWEGLQALGKNWHFQLMGTPKPEVIRKAAATIVAVGFDRFTEGENFDRTYTLPKGQAELIERVLSYTDKVILVVNSGGEVDLAPWKDRVKAIILDWYPGQEGGYALASILTGKVSPSGRLPFTWWGALDKNPAQQWYAPAPQLNPDKLRQHYEYTVYGEGIFLGYRGVEHFGEAPLYPFGYGLGYACFDYSDLSVLPSGDGYDVLFTVRNTGEMEAKEVAQVYVAPLNPSLPRPLRELKGYDKQSIAKGEAVSYCIHLGPDAFSHYDVASHSWKTDPGQYRIEVGASSADIRLDCTIELPSQLDLAPAAPMKARVIQQAFSPDGKDLQANFDWTLFQLEACDESLDIVVLPEAASHPGKTSSTEEFLAVGRRNIPLLLDACSRTARRCSTLVFVGAYDLSYDQPRNTVFAFDRTGQLVGKYYKQHPTAGERKWQDVSYTREWEEPYILEIEGLKFAFLICYDFYFYENYANIARWKPDIVIGCSHQRSDTFRALDLINAFCAYHTGAYVVRASVSMGLDSDLGGCSCVVAPTGEILRTLRSEVDVLDVTFDPHEKYLKPAGYGNPPAMHSEYIEIGRRPWKYRPGGSAIVPPLAESSENRSVVSSNDMATLGAAIATGVQEIAITLDAAAPWESFLRDVLKHFSCHAIMNIRLVGEGWDDAASQKVKNLVFAYDAQEYVYYTIVR